jgi:hypothetical protein
MRLELEYPNTANKSNLNTELSNNTSSQTPATREPVTASHAKQWKKEIYQMGRAITFFLMLIVAIGKTAKAHTN